MIKVEQLVKQYKGAENPSVNELSFSFEAGKIVGLLGPNGAGKTTTISILCGLIKEFSGDVHVLGYDVKTQLEILKYKVGIVPQQIALYPTLSCKENLLYYGKLYQIPKLELDEIIASYLQEFGLYDHANKQIKHYSGGMKRRANIIASLLNKPKLLILDEPTAGVDVQSRSMILNFLKRYNAQGNAVLYTSHLLEEAEEMCHEVLIIDNGKKIIQGQPKVLIQENNTTNLEDLFLKLTGNKVRD